MKRGIVYSILLLFVAGSALAQWTPKPTATPRPTPRPPAPTATPIPIVPTPTPTVAIPSTPSPTKTPTPIIIVTPTVIPTIVPTITATPTPMVTPGVVQIYFSAFEYSGWLTVKNAKVNDVVYIEIVAPDGTKGESQRITLSSSNYTSAVHISNFAPKSMAKVYINGVSVFQLTLP